VISWFKPIFQECDALAFNEGRKFPIAAFINARRFNI
jgi:hypothetical protein